MVDCFSVFYVYFSRTYQPIDIDKKATEILTSTIQQTNDEMNAITNDCDKKENWCGRRSMHSYSG